MSAGAFLYFASDTLRMTVCTQGLCASDDIKAHRLRRCWCCAGPGAVHVPDIEAYCVRPKIVLQADAWNVNSDVAHSDEQL